jgi:hypothetical protein
VIVPEPVVVIFPAPEIFPVSVKVSPDGKVIPPFAVSSPVTANVFPIETVDVALPIEIGTTFVETVAIFTAPVASRPAFCPILISPSV